MNCQCQGIENVFNERTVNQEIATYHKKGPDQTTRLMIDALKRERVEGLTLLDIGGGVGAIQHALLEAGVQSATDVDASHAYIEAARREAEQRGITDQIRFLHGNFVDLAARVPPAGIVTLDRVICCFNDMERLVDLSAAQAERLYGVVYLRDTWWVKLGVALLNAFLRLQRNPFRSFVYPTRSVEAILKRHGLQRRYYQRTLVWQVAVFAR